MPSREQPGPRHVSPKTTHRRGTMKVFDLELRNAEVDVKVLEGRLRLVPMNDAQLAGALRSALEAKRDRLRKLQARESPV